MTAHERTDRVHDSHDHPGPDSADYGTTGGWPEQERKRMGGYDTPGTIGHMQDTSGISPGDTVGSTRGRRTFMAERMQR